MTPHSIETIKQTLFSAAESACEALMERFGNLKSIEHKGEVDLVTAADRESEERVIRTIREAAPDHLILAEESAAHGPEDSEWRWIVDPLDGTTNYAHSLPPFSVSIGVEHRGELALGLVKAPALGETYFAESGKGATLNGDSIRVSRVEQLKQALAATGFAYDRHERPEYYLKFVAAIMREAQGIRRAGCASLDLCSIACGRLDVYWEENLKPWDTAAGALIAREAGGTVTNFDGGLFNVDKGQIAASNGLLHEEFLRIIQQAMAVRPE